MFIIDNISIVVLSWTKYLHFFVMALKALLLLLLLLIHHDVFEKK